MSATDSTKILVIDDDEMALVMIRKLLEAEDCSVEVLTSAREALAKLPENHYDAILCDMWMPGMNGKEFYEQVKNDFPEYQRRIIFVTGDIASEATWDFIDDRHLPYVIKPFSRPVDTPPAPGQTKLPIARILAEWPIWRTRMGG